MTHTVTGCKDVMKYEVSITKSGELRPFWSKRVATPDDVLRVVAKNQQLIDRHRWDHTIAIKEIP